MSYRLSPYTSFITATLSQFKTKMKRLEKNEKVKGEEKEKKKLVEDKSIHSFDLTVHYL